MSVECPTHNVDGFNKPSRMKLCARRRKDYFKPLHVDCSVEYELPNSAKPPAGNKNEPLLMIHPSYYRREESKRRRQFVNNLPRRRTSGRCTRSAVARDVENSNNYGTNNYVSTRQRINCVDRKSITEDVRSSSATFHTQTNFDHTCLQVKNDSRCKKESQSSLIQTNVCYTSNDLISLWKRTIDFDEGSQVMTALPLSERAPIPVTVPVADSASTCIIDSCEPNFHLVNINDDIHDINNNHDKNYSNRIRNRSKRNFDGPVTMPTPKPKVMKKSVVCCEASIALSAMNSVAGNANAGMTIRQRQPAVGVAAIAAPPLDCHDCSSVFPGIEGNHHSVTRQQPWSASTAPEYPPSSLPLNRFVPKRAFIDIIDPHVPPQLSSARKRTSDGIWWYDESCNDDSSSGKRNRMNINENVRICHARFRATNESEFRKMYYPQETYDGYNYSNGCAVAGNPPATSCSSGAWNRSNDNFNTLHLFRL